MKINNKKEIKISNKTLILIFSLLFLSFTVFFIFLTKNEVVKWMAPDENANYVFSKLYAETDRVYFYEKYNPLVKEIIRPRSFGTSESLVRPVSFLGLILIYGFIAKLTFSGIIPYLTPIFAFFGIFFFYLFIKKIFGEKVAFISALVLSFFPIYVYYSARSMFHNVLFTVLLIISLYFSFLMTEKRDNKKFINYLGSILGGFFLGLAVITRTSELLWLGPLFLFLWIFNIRKVGFTKLVIFAFFAFLAVLPVVYWNNFLYGVDVSGGYPQMNQSIDKLISTSSSLAKETIHTNFSQIKYYIKSLQTTIFHFGFKPRYSLKMFYEYFYKMFTWLFVGGLLGFLIFCFNFKKIRKKHLLYIFGSILISSILIFYYGSWIFFDNPGKTYTIGNSYTRYWLPIYLAFIPFFSLFVLTIVNFFSSKLIKTAILSILIFCLGAYSYNFLLFGSEEGLIHSYYKQLNDLKEYKEVINLTENNSVIITQYHDKLFFPERKIIVGLFNDNNMNIEYARIAKYFPVYYYNFRLSSKDMDYLNNTKLKLSGFNIVKIKDITKDFTLYKLILL